MQRGAIVVGTDIFWIERNRPVVSSHRPCRFAGGGQNDSQIKSDRGIFGVELSGSFQRLRGREMPANFLLQDGPVEEERGIIRVEIARLAVFLDGVGRPAETQSLRELKG